MVVQKIASATVTGRDLERQLSAGRGKPIVYTRNAEEVLAARPLLRQMTALLDAGPLAGDADLALLRSLVPELTSFEAWMRGKAVRRSRLHCMALPRTGMNPGPLRSPAAERWIGFGPRRHLDDRHR